MDPKYSSHQVKTFTSIDESPFGDWQQWLTQQALFNRHQVLHAMEHSGCVDQDTGWIPNHLGIYQEESLKAFLPLYIKKHSYGEYMFDWQWANGLHRAGIAYYPKAVSAIPFTPVTGPRLTQPDDSLDIYTATIQHVAQMPISNFQCLFLCGSQPLWLIEFPTFHRDD